VGRNGLAKNEGTRTRRVAKKLFIGSPFEGVARSIYQRFSPSRSYDRETTALMKRCLRKNSNCVDVGCYEGSVLHDILKLAPEGVHYAFEPLPAFYQEFASSYPEARLYNLALSDTEGKTTFQYVISNPGYSGLKPRSYPASEEIEQIEVETNLLDNIIPSDLPIHFIKIDVEGAELQVLKGAARTIHKNKPIILFEYEKGASDHYGVPQDAYDFLTKDCSLRVSTMKGWLKDEAALSRQEFGETFYQNAYIYFVAH
jgi:FkbM family methyltransferase